MNDRNWCDNETIQDFCVRYLFEQAEDSNATFEEDPVKVSFV